MQVTNISVRVQRRIQVRDYEPKEVEASVSATLEEGEDHETALASIMHDANVAVENGIKGTPPAKKVSSSKAETDEDEDEKPKSKPKKVAAKKAAPKDDLPDEDEKPKSKKAAPKDDLPDEDEKPKSKPKKDDTPDEDEFGEAEDKSDDEVMSASELQKYISGLINNKQITVAQVKDVMSEFGIKFTRESTDEQRPKIKAMIDKIASEEEEI
jgi:outer membrane biosynthesis protein TonB